MTTPGPNYRRLFGGDPGGYDRARPDYPSRVYELLTARCGLRPGTATLEIGPGTGIATRRLLALGADPPRRRRARRTARLVPVRAAPGRGPLGRPAANASGRLPFPLDAEARVADLRAVGVFDEIDHEIMPWPARFNPSQVRALYSTFPNVSGLPEPRRSEVLDALAAIAEREFGGLVERTFYTSIYVARRA